MPSESPALDRPPAERQERQRWYASHPDERHAALLLDAKREVRLLSDRDLAAFLARKERERVRDKAPPAAPLWLLEDTTARIQAAREETSRRQRLAKFGGPPVRLGQANVTEIKARHELLDLVVEALGPPDKMARDAYWWLCCFHQERTPSLLVTPSKQLFYCHSCGIGGDVVRFVELFERIDFADALRRLGGEREQLPTRRLVGV